MKKVLITGCAGFIGSNLVERCVEEGWEVYGVDDLSNGRVEFLHPDIKKFFESDFSEGVPVSWVRQGIFDTVFHLAAVPRVSYSVEHPLETNDCNVSKTLKLMEACRGNVKRLVFASSSSVYGGATQLPTTEFSFKDPKSPYALQKSIIEDYLRLYSGLYGLDSACLRFFNVFGENQLGTSPYACAVSSWLTAIKQGKPMRSDGDGTQSRDLCHVKNVVEACVLAAKHEQPLEAQRFNVACGDRTTNREILDYMLKRYPGSTSVDAPWRPGDVMHTQADITKAKSVLGYEPIVRVWDGIERTCAWFDENWDWIKDLKLRT